MHPLIIKYWKEQGYTVIKGINTYLAYKDNTVGFSINNLDRYYLYPPNVSNENYNEEQALRFIKMKAFW